MKFHSFLLADLSPPPAARPWKRLLGTLGFLLAVLYLHGLLLSRHSLGDSLARMKTQRSDYPERYETWKSDSVEPIRVIVNERISLGDFECLVRGDVSMPAVSCAQPSPVSLAYFFNTPPCVFGQELYPDADCQTAVVKLFQFHPDDIRFLAGPWRAAREHFIAFMVSTMYLHERDAFVLARTPTDVRLISANRGSIEGAHVIDVFSDRGHVALYVREAALDRAIDLARRLQIQFPGPNP